MRNLKNGLYTLFLRRKVSTDFVNKRNSQANDECRFHDDWASEIDVKTIPVKAYFEGSTCPENRFILQHLGSLNNLRVLELGAGVAEASAYFAIQGARCMVTDISEGMLQKARQLAHYHGQKIETGSMEADKIEFPDDTFDIVYAANLLHHTNSPEQTLKEMHRVVKRGGKVCFWDPLRHNIVINIYRKLATKVRTPDEAPLDISLVRFAKELFADVKYDTFWLISLWIFIKFYFFDRIDPNQERYWKKIIYEEPRIKGLYLRLEKCDDWLKKTMPCFKRYAWNLAVVATK